MITDFMISIVAAYCFFSLKKSKASKYWKLAFLFLSLSAFAGGAHHGFKNLWSQELDFGYYSKPPLLAWFLSAHIFLFGSSFFSLKMFPLLVYFFVFFTFYRLCLELNLSKNNSVVCSIGFLSIPAVSVSSFLISTDLLLLLFWGLAMIFVLKIKTNGSLINFILLGVFLGLAFLAKYAAIYFLLSFSILVLIDNGMLLTLKKNKGRFFVFVFDSFCMCVCSRLVSLFCFRLFDFCFCSLCVVLFSRLFSCFVFVCLFLCFSVACFFLKCDQLS